MSTQEQEHAGTVNQKILILGHGGHGKDEVAKLLAEKFGIAFRGSSEFCAEHVVYPTVSYIYSNYMECFEDRRNQREHWHKTISSYNSPDKTRLATELLASGVDVYVGMRCKEELAACMEESLFDVVIWVDASERVPPEDKSSMSITLADVMDLCRVRFATVNNNGTKEELVKSVELLGEWLDRPVHTMSLTEKRIAAMKYLCCFLEGEEYSEYSEEDWKHINVIRAFLGSKA